MRHGLHPRVEGCYCDGEAGRLVDPQPGLGVRHLAVQVAGLHGVVVHQAQPPHTRPRQVQSRGATQTWQQIQIVQPSDTNGEIA